MRSYLRVKNFEKFQHYKDRCPPWIKLYGDLLEDYDFATLTDAHKGHLMCIWILASRVGNRIPNDPLWIANKIGATDPVDLDTMIAAGWLAEYDQEEAKGKTEEWASRYISKPVRARVMERCNNACVECGATDKLEIDHIIPVSKGGTGEEDNLQVLCRSCNRRKRATFSPDAGCAATEQAATQIRSTETEAEANLSISPSAEAPMDREEVADLAIIAVNQGVLKNPAIEHPRTIEVGHGRSRQAVADWLDEGIPAELIFSVVKEGARKYRPSGRNRQPNSLTYFSNAVREAWDRKQVEMAPEVAPDSEAAAVRSNPRRESPGRSRELEAAPRQPDRTGMHTIGQVMSEAEASKETRDDALIREWEAADEMAAKRVMQRAASQVRSAMPGRDVPQQVIERTTRARYRQMALEEINRKDAA